MRFRVRVRFRVRAGAGAGPDMVQGDWRADSFPFWWARWRRCSTDMLLGDG